MLGGMAAPMGVVAEALLPRTPLVFALIALVGCRAPARPPALPPAAPSESPHVLVLGHVKIPGPLLFRPGLELREAIRSCGGFTPLAYRRAVVVTRDTVDGRRVRVRVSADDEAEPVWLARGDLVLVTARDGY